MTFFGGRTTIIEAIWVLAAAAATGRSVRLRAQTRRDLRLFQMRGTEPEVEVARKNLQLDTLRSVLAAAMLTVASISASTIPPTSPTIRAISQGLLVGITVGMESLGRLLGRWRPSRDRRTP